MKNSAKSLLVITLCLSLFSVNSFSQEEDKGTYIGFIFGKMNYQGDLNPNSFTFSHSKATTGISIRQSLNRWISFRGGFTIGHIDAADHYNRDYLKTRNLSFKTTIKEVSVGLEASLLDLSTSHFTPYVFGDAVLYHFNPWAYDMSGNKVFLNPLSTEGQGLSQYPEQKPYKLTQIALGFGFGARYAINKNINIGVEMIQRKTFTDHLDDVSSIYVDQNVLLQAKGAKAVEMAYRGDEITGGLPYPTHGDKRGTPTEMDWYYFFGVNFEIKLSAFAQLFKGLKPENSSALHFARCPRNVHQ
jgi:hypothetical protein